jgi:hypothetical protein
MTPIGRLTIAAAAVATAMTIHVATSAASSYGNAPWCAVQDLGAGDVVWDCEYQTVQQCQPQVIAGNRGFCNVNPQWTPPPRPGPYASRRRHPG